MLLAWPFGFPHSGDAPPGRAEGPSMAHRRWLGVLPRSPAPRRLRSACAQVALSGVCEFCVEDQDQELCLRLCFFAMVQTPPTRRWRRPSGGVAQGGTRQEPSRAAGHEWRSQSTSGRGPRSDAGGREPRRGQARSNAFAYFGRNQSRPAVRAGTRRPSGCGNGYAPRATSSHLNDICIAVIAGKCDPHVCCATARRQGGGRSPTRHAYPRSAAKRQQTERCGVSGRSRDCLSPASWLLRAWCCPWKRETDYRCGLPCSLVIN